MSFQANRQKYLRLNKQDNFYCEVTLNYKRILSTLLHIQVGIYHKTKLSIQLILPRGTSILLICVTVQIVVLASALAHVLVGCITHPTQKYYSIFGKTLYKNHMFV